MGSLPSLSGDRGRLVTIAGSVPTPFDMPVGCRFAVRCPFAVERCDERPDLQEAAPGHGVACWRAPLESMVESEREVQIA